MEVSRQLSRSLQHLPVENATENGITVDHFHSPESRDEHFTLPGRTSPTTERARMLTRSLPRQPTSTPSIEAPLERAQTGLLRQGAVKRVNLSRTYPVQKSGLGVGEEGGNSAETGGGEGGGAEQTRGLAECGLCLDEFQDTGDKVPRNLICGHTYCTG